MHTHTHAHTHTNTEEIMMRYYSIVELQYNTTIYVYVVSLTVNGLTAHVSALKVLTALANLFIL